MIVEILAVLSVSAAVGMRIGLPLLVISLLYAGFWARLPLLSLIPPPVAIAILTSWSLFEIFASKQLLGQRIVQLVQLLFSPIAGALMAMAILEWMNSDFQPRWILAGVGGTLALVLKLVQVGWFFRLRGLPLWVLVGEDLIRVALVFLAFRSPQKGGLIAMLLLWLAVRASADWYRWYRQQPHASK